MTFLEALAGVPILALSGSADRRVVRVSEDSRDLDSDTIFAAVPGTGRDGFSFIPAALAAGCRAFLVQRPIDEALAQQWPELCVALVPDARRACARVAHRLSGEPGRRLDVFGVTGTNGKTTTTFLLQAILRAAGRRCGVVGTTGILWDAHSGPKSHPATHTTPGGPALMATLAAMAEDGVDSAAIELSSHALDQGRACGLPLRGAGWTNLGRDHLDYHDTVEAYGAAKRLLLDELLSEDGQPGATLTVFDDDPYCSAVAAGAPGSVRVSAVPGAVANRGVDLAPATEARHDLGGTRVRVEGRWGTFDLHTPTLGAHNLHNALVAAGMALSTGVSVAAVTEGLAACQGAPGRLERVPGPSSGPFVLVDFAHTPEAVDRVLAAVRPWVRGRLIAVLGCGGDRDRGKRPLMAAAAAARADLVVLTSDNPRSEDPDRILDEMIGGVDASRLALRPADSGAVRREVDRRQAIGLALRGAGPDDVVIIAGKGHERWQEAGGYKLPFDDVEVARGLLLDSR